MDTMTLYCLNSFFTTGFATIYDQRIARESFLTRISTLLKNIAVIILPLPPN